MSMVAPIENRTEIDGVVTSRTPHESVDRWDVLEVRVADTAPVEGYPDLLSRQVSEQPSGTLTIATDRSHLPDGDLDGWHFHGQAMLAGPGVIRAVTDASGAPGVELFPPPSPQL